MLRGTLKDADRLIYGAAAVAVVLTIKVHFAHYAMSRHNNIIIMVKETKLRNSSGKLIKYRLLG